MVGWSRRQALRAIAAGVAVAVAGCREENRFAEETPNVEDLRPVEEYESEKVRDRDARPIFWTEEQTPQTGSGEQSRQTPYSKAEVISNAHTYVTTTDELASVTFAPGNSAGDRLQAFIEATDFAERSVALLMATVAQCREFRLYDVARGPDSYELSFCRPFRSPETTCETEAYDTVAVAVRLPFSGDGISGRGTSWHDECRAPPYPIFPETPTEGEDE
ncbi:MULTISPECIES: hypothetical protein [Salinibaculum]|uniref:hypothetical protein n=1 Tax=Salinibaculum TaxID=2732368 RepID=UPI0030D1518C